MTYTQHPGDEPDFPHDKVADVVLHKDDDPEVPAPAAENEPVEEWTGDGVNDGNCWFPIHFSHAGVNYTADVQTRIGDVKEYHVSGVTPAIDYLPDPYVIAEHISREKYDYPVNEAYYPEVLGQAMVRAIEDGSNMTGPDPV